MLSPVILMLCWPTFTVNLYSPSDVSFDERLCNGTLGPLALRDFDTCEMLVDDVTLRIAFNWSSELDEVRELHEPAPATPPPAHSVSSERIGDALRRMVSSINCFAKLRGAIGPKAKKIDKTFCNDSNMIC